jgi:SAM-dependent MidA family methyltransferase
MAFVRYIPCRKIPRNVDQFELPCLGSLRAFFSTQKLIGDEPVLVRDFIHTALYDPIQGYFSQRSKSVGVLERSIKFNQLEGRKAYMKLLEKVYKQSDISWFTPVELFKPWYAHGIAEAILRTTNLSVPLKIYEIGGGSGTCAKGVLDYIMLNAPERIYKNMSYTSIEISPSLAKIQKETVAQVGSHLSKFRVECRDASDLAGWKNVEQQPCWVIMLEVLDNLPHDLVYSKSQLSPWMEVLVENKPESEALSELYKPLEDPLIKRCIEIVEHEDDPVSKPKEIWSKLFPKPRRSWLPTGCLVRKKWCPHITTDVVLLCSNFCNFRNC